jgi:hypothetical protein
MAEIMSGIGTLVERANIIQPGGRIEVIRSHQDLIDPWR